MATKKPMTDKPFGKVGDSPELTTSEPIPEVASTAIPVVAAVDTQHVAETSSRREVVVNQHYSELMTYLTVLRDSFHDGQVQADFNQAIVATRTAHLWALQAVKNVS
jgi:hypothetical protein